MSATRRGYLKMVAVVAVALLLAAVAAVLARPGFLPLWVIPACCALTAVVTGVTPVGTARAALNPLLAPLGFLLTAVPLALGLERLGFFAAVADRVIAAGRGSGSLWVLAAVVTTTLNLDASVVLLTPLYVQIARRTRRDPLALAFQPVLLACLASSALPVSNLTNLIAASATGADTIQFMTRLALPSLVATSLGWWLYRQRLMPDQVVACPIMCDSTTRVVRSNALLLGSIVLAVVFVGFVFGAGAGVAPWIVALTADVVLLAGARCAPWRDIPVGTAVVVASIGVLATSVVMRLRLGTLANGRTVGSLARTIGAAAVGANLMNNLTALLVALPSVGASATPQLWAVLIGVNMGPVVLATGSLASLLWLDTLTRLDVRVRPRDFTRVGLRVGLPAAAGGAATFLLMQFIAGR